MNLVLLCCWRQWENVGLEADSQIIINTAAALVGNTFNSWLW